LEIEKEESDWRHRLELESHNTNRKTDYTCGLVLDLKAAIRKMGETLVRMEAEMVGIKAEMARIADEDEEEREEEKREAADKKAEESSENDAEGVVGEIVDEDETMQE
jgi:hypothetical protein